VAVITCSITALLLLSKTVTPVPAPQGNIPELNTSLSTRFNVYTNPLTSEKASIMYFKILKHLTSQPYAWMSLSVRLSIRPSVRPSAIYIDNIITL
jgi:hypothetical protein